LDLTDRTLYPRPIADPPPGTLQRSRGRASPPRRRRVASTAPLSLSTGTTWGILAVLVPVAASAFGRMHAIDLAYQLRAGEIMLRTRTLLDTDVFTFTAAGDRWTNQQWGAQVALAWVFDLGGWAGLAVLRLGLVGMSAWLIYAAMRRVDAPPRVAAPLTIGGWLVGIEIVTMLRPQLLSVALFAVGLYAVASRRARPSLLWSLPAVVLVWANVHGSFPLIFVLLFAAWIDDRRSDPALARTIARVAAVTFLATWVNPWGPAVWGYVWSLSSDIAFAGRIAEWGPPSFHTFSGGAFVLSVVATVLVVAYLRPAVSLGESILVAAFALGGFVAIRGVVWWGMVAPVVVAGWIVRQHAAPARSRAGEIERPLVNLAVVIALLGLLGLGFVSRTGTDPVSGAPRSVSYAPERLVRAAADGLEEGSRAFVSQVYGSWVELSAPGLLVAVDSRIEVFPQDVWSHYFAISDGRADWEGLIDRWDVQVLVLHPIQAEGLLSVIAGSDAWRLVIRTSDGAVYVRR
jgi:hypothetical protein